MATKATQNSERDAASAPEINGVEDAQIQLSYEELQDRFNKLTATPEEEAQYLKLRKNRAQGIAQRQTAIAEIVKAMYRDEANPITVAELIKLQPGLRPEIGSIYDESELIAAARARNVKFSRSPKTAVTTDEKAPRAKNAKRASDDNPVLFTITKKGDELGKNFSYHQGRVYEQASSAVKTPWAITETFSGKLRRAGGSKETLAEYFSEEGKKYFETPKGREELAKILEEVAKAEETLSKNPAKKKAAKKAAKKTAEASAA